jgi:ferric-dicitrate binding protein FerR (iron transport regulator)
MENLLDALLFDDNLSTEERSALRERFEGDPSLADAWEHWRHVRGYVRGQLQEHLSDRRLLVLYVLDRDGHEEVLTQTEREVLDEARADIARALDRIPALEQVVERIREEKEAFEEAWETQAPFSEEASPVSIDEEVPQSQDRKDRAPRALRSREGASLRQWSRRLVLTVLVVGVALGILMLWPSGPAVTTVTVAERERRTVEVGGESTVRLVGEATLTHPTEPSSEGPRRVTLQEGRAFFDVQPRPDGSSFVVETPTATATVLGTQFGVTARHDTTEVVLASGSVEVGAAGEQSDNRVVLEPGQKSWVVGEGAPSSPAPADLTEALDWTGLFVFRAVPIAAITDRLSRHYEVSITVAEDLRDEPVTGTFEREQPVRQVLDALAATLGAEVEQEGDVYRLVSSQ